MQQFDVIVLGAGAAGLMCAFTAGQRGRRVAVVEHQDQPGKKILISGGGRCNFTNRHTTPANFLSANPHFCKSALARYTPADFVKLVEQHRIDYHEKTLGQLFCDGSARQMVDLLLTECRKGQVKLLTGCPVREVRRPDEFVVETGAGPLRAPSLVVATGGLSIPKMGATPLGYRVASQFGLATRSCWPALVPFTFGALERERWCDLSGVSTEVVAALPDQQFREKLLITHRGLSGPSVLQISSYWQPGQTVAIDLLPDQDVAAELLAAKRRRDKAEWKTMLSRWLPQRFAERWCQWHAPARGVAVVADAEIRAFAAGLHRWTVTPDGTEGYGKAEVTAGGVDTNELSSRTMEAKRVPGLYFVGEVMDVTGHLGGFNFQWAWASGYSAGMAV